MIKKVKDEWAPLSGGFMLTSIFGFLISVWLISDMSVTWSFTFAFFFVIMFFASIISMTKAEPIKGHMDVLAIHEPEKAYKPFTKKVASIKKDKNMNWYEPLFFLYLAVWVYYLVHYILGSIDYTHMYLAIGFLAFTILFVIIFLVDLFSAEFLPTWEQIVFAIILIVTAGYGAVFFPIAPIGMILYYLHIKILQKQ